MWPGPNQCFLKWILSQDPQQGSQWIRIRNAAFHYGFISKKHSAGWATGRQCPSTPQSLGRTLFEQHHSRIQKSRTSTIQVPGQDFIAARQSQTIINFNHPTGSWIGLYLNLHRSGAWIGLYFNIPFQYLKIKNFYPSGAWIGLYCKTTIATSDNHQLPPNRCLGRT